MDDNVPTLYTLLQEYDLSMAEIIDASGITFMIIWYMIDGCPVLYEDALSILRGFNSLCGTHITINDIWCPLKKASS